MIEERKKKEAEWKARQEEIKKIREEKQREWEQAQLKKLDTHPYLNEIDQCEHLIYFCAKNRPAPETPAEEEDKKESVDA